ncbi:hypothetical protein COLO4_37490 [Corchorus olitorius]|uniref:Uncharacterized protein n=1 Tax=Corchorus olitorius TaxID=93759 RepID=A0A1R3G164_9ROSI|nr:hypothetical protein COLO4_37490 [Corchorus olitorius]
MKAEQFFFEEGVQEWEANVRKGCRLFRAAWSVVFYMIGILPIRQFILSYGKNFGSLMLYHFCIKTWLLHIVWSSTYFLDTAVTHVVPFLHQDLVATYSLEQHILSRHNRDLFNKLSPFILKFEWARDMIRRNVMARYYGMLLFLHDYGHYGVLSWLKRFRCSKVGHELGISKLLPHIWNMYKEVLWKGTKNGRNFYFPSLFSKLIQVDQHVVAKPIKDMEIQGLHMWYAEHMMPEVEKSSFQNG